MGRFLHGGQQGERECLEIKLKIGVVAVPILLQKMDAKGE